MRELPFGPLTLAQLNSNEEMEVLEALLRTKESNLDDERSGGLPPDVVQALARVSNDPKHLSVTRALAMLKTMQSTDGLKAIITNEKQDVVVRIVASYELLTDGPPEAIVFLSSIVEDRKYSLSVRWAVIPAMNVSSEKKLDGLALVRLAKDSAQEPVIRRLALTALRSFKNELPKGAPDALLTALRSGDGELALAAAETLGKLQDHLQDAFQNRFTEVLIALNDIAFDETKPQDLRQVAFEALTEIDRIPGLRDRALGLFHNSRVAEPLRHAAAEAVLKYPVGETAHAAAHLAVLCDLNASQRLRDDALALLKDSNSKSASFLNAIKAALPTIGPMLGRDKGSDHHRAMLMGFLLSLAKQGLLLEELGQSLPMLKTIARDSTEDNSRSREAAIALLLVLADGSRTVAAFLEAMAVDQSVDMRLRTTIIEGLSKTAKAALPGSVLLRIIQDSKTPDRVSLAAIEAMGRLGSDARPFEQAMLALTAQGQSLGFRERALEAMARMGVVSKDLAKAAADLLLHPEDPSSRRDRSSTEPSSEQRTAARVLGGLRTHAESVLPRLVAALDDMRFDEQRKRLIAAVIATIGTALADAGDVTAIPQLEAALKAMEKLIITEPQAEVKRAIRALENEWLRGLLHDAGSFLASHVALTAGLLYVVIALLLGLLLLYFAPLSLYRLNTWVANVPEFTLPTFLGGLTLSVRPLLVVTIFRHHMRVIDAWVEYVLPTVREEFSKKKAVHLRRLHIPMPVEIDGVTEPVFEPEKLRKVTNHKRFFLAVEGEGGAGKSSLAFQLAHWAIAGDSKERLATFQMIPILLEYDLPEKDEEAPVLKAIQTELMNITRSQEPLPEEFVRVLLVRQRLLVIADRVSELSTYTQQQIMAAVPALPISAFMVTSRREETWQGTSKTTLHPVRISGNFVANFLDAYLTRREARSLFKDEDFFEVCRGLSVLARERDMTPLLGKMYAEYALARKKAVSPDPGSAAPAQPDGSIPQPAEESLRSIPALVSRYVDQVSGSVKSPFGQHQVHDILQCIAWECVRDGFRPGSASLEQVHAALGDLAAQKLAFAVNQLGLVQMAGLSRDQVRFALDPLAEYLAAMAMLQRFGADEAAWTTALDSLARVLRAGGGHAFIQVLMDCCGTDLAKALPPNAHARIEHMANALVAQFPLRASA